MNLLSVISLSLGITNLLPFPPLDGGKIVIYIIEWIRKKPLKENIEMGLQSVGFALIIVLSIYVAFNDVTRAKGTDLLAQHSQICYVEPKGPSLWLF